MLKLGAIVTVVLASLITSHGLHLQQKDVLHLLEVLKVKDDLETRQQQVEDNQSKDDSEEKIEVNSMNGLLKKMEIIDLIEKADKEETKTKFGEIKLTRDELPKDYYGDYDMVATNQGNDMIEELVHGKRPKDFQKRNHHVLNPNNLLGTSQVDDGQRDPKDPLNEYFRVFVVIDPAALEKSASKDTLLKMISKINALSPSLPEKARQNRERNRNSRFKVKNNLMARRYRDSKEGYDDDEYKPSRSRHDDTASGNGGRTGIPYMRPRGDIYEKN